MSAKTTLSLQDRLSGPLQRVMKAMDSTIRVMEQMDSATVQLDQRSLASARKNIDGASAELSNLSASMNTAAESAGQAAEQQDRMNQAVNNFNPAGAQNLESFMGDVAISASNASEEIAKVGLNTPGMNAAAQMNDRLTKSYDTVTGSIGQVEAILDKASSSFESVSKSTEDANKSSENYSRVLQRMKPPTVLERIKNLFRSTGKETEEVTKKQTRFQQVLNQIRPSGILENLKSVYKQVGDAADDASRRNNRFNESMRIGEFNAKGLIAGLLGAVGAYKTFNAAKGLMQNILGQGVEFHAFKQASQIAFTTFLGDADKAQEYMDNMYAFALKTPFAYPDLLESSRNLIAFGIAAENTFPIMQSIGDAVAGIGGGNAEMKNMADIFGQIQAQGRITAMEVNRLSSYGVNAYEMLGQAAGMSADAMKKEISAGAIDAGTAIGGLVEGMNKQFGGLMEGVEGTWAGAVDSMRSAMRNAGTEMMESFMVAEGPLVTMVNNITGLIKKIPQYIGPALAAFIPLIDMLNNAFDANRFDPFFATLGASITFIATMFSFIGQTAVWAAGIIADNWSWIAPIIMTAAAALGTYVGVLLTYRTIMLIVAGVQALKTMWLGITAAATMIAAGATLAQTAAQHGLNAALLAFPGTWILMLFVGVIALVIYAMIAWADQTAVAIGAIVGSVFWLGTVFWNILLGIANFGILVAEWIVNAWNEGVYMTQLAWIGLNIAIRTILDAIANGALTVAEFFANVWNKAVFGVQNGFYKMQEGILTVMSSVASGVTNAVNGALSALSTLINGAVSGINSLISLINKIPGVNIGEIGDVDLKASTAAVDKLNDMKANLTAPTEASPVSFERVNMAGDYAANANMPTAAEKVSFGRLDYADPTAAFKKGQAIGSNMSLAASDKLSGAMDKMTGLLKGGGDQGSLFNAGEVPTGGFDPTLGNPTGLGGLSAPGGAGKTPGAANKKTPGSIRGSNNPTGGTLDSIGKIEDDVNFADEDLKMLRELAERDSIERVSTTLTPTVNVTFGDTHVRKESDIKKIVRNIEKVFKEEMAESTEGLYT